MFETYFAHRRVIDIDQMKAGPMGPYLGSYATYLEDEGYLKNTIRDKLRAADAFCWWLQRSGLHLRDANEESVALYVAGFSRVPCRCKPRGRLPQIALGLNKLISFLREHEIVPPRLVSPPRTEADSFIAAFEEHLDQVFGLSSSTRHKYLRYARRFIDYRFSEASLRWASLKAEDVTEFVLREASRLDFPRDVVSASRALLRFLTSRDLIHPVLIGAVPRIRTWKLAALPQYLSEDEVESTLRACQDGTPIGTRDRAILILLARFGLRAREVARIWLDDIDWVEGRVLIRAGKTRCERSLPLPQEVGNAIVAYLKDVRPRSDHRSLFLRCIAPFQPLSRFTVSSIARCRLKQAGVKAVRLGAGSFRHTAATHMVRRGATFKEVADVLGHRHLGTTNVYAKLNIEALARVAMAWPGGVQ